MFAGYSRRMPDIAVPGGPAALSAYRPSYQPPNLGRREEGEGASSHLLPDEFLMLEWGIRSRNFRGRMINNSYQLINLSVIYRWCLWLRPPSDRMWLLSWSSAWPCHRGDDTLLTSDSLSRSHCNKKYRLRGEQLRMNEACYGMRR